MGAKNAEPRDVLSGIKAGLTEYFCHLAADQACYTLRLLLANE